MLHLLPRLFRFAAAGLMAACLGAPLVAQPMELSLRFQKPTSEGSNRYHQLTRSERWEARHTALIICDMWDSHTSVSAVRRVAELAPRINTVANQLRSQGVTIIHAPSSCMDFYATHPARLRAQSLPPASSFPEDISSWCDQIPAEEVAEYPLDQAEGGRDDDPSELQRWSEQLAAQGRKTTGPWLSQTDVIEIEPQLDYISDQGREVWSILEHQGISNVIMVGVHTNMCVLGRPFGLRRMTAAGKNVVLVRDLTDTMYDPRAWPYANHFSGTDLIVSHIERFVCPTISSEQILGGEEFRFSKDRRPHLVLMIAEDEYQTEQSLPKFAAKHLSKNFRVSYLFGSEENRNEIPGIAVLESADALLVSVRRRSLPEADLESIRQFIRAGKPLIGIRTASHAFSLRNEEPSVGNAVWPEFDAEAFGGNYTNHFGNDLKATLAVSPKTSAHPLLTSIGKLQINPAGSLYKTSPLAAGTTMLLEGSVPSVDTREPVAWTYVRADGGRSFYTSLGHPDDFTQPQFEALLSAGIHWACELDIPTFADVEAQNQRYSSGHGRQR